MSAAGAIPIRKSNRLTAADLAVPNLPRRWAVEWLGMAPGRPTVLCGEGGARKGWLAMTVALLGAADMDLWGHKLGDKLSWCYFDWEQTLYETKERFQRLAKGYRIDLASLGTRLQYEWMPVGSLAKPGTVDEMCRQVEGVDVAIVDSTRASTPGVKENSEEAGIAGQNVTNVSEKVGTSFVLLDHAGLPDASGQRQRQHAQRGHTSKRDISSTLLVCSTQKGEPTLVTTERCQTKPQEQWADPFLFKLALQNGGGLRLELCEPPEVKADDDLEERVARVLQCIEKNPGIAGNLAIASKIKMGDKQVSAIVSMLAAEGRIVLVKASGQGQGRRIYPAGYEAPFG